jgi:hypothetical protein
MARHTHLTDSTVSLGIRRMLSILRKSLSPVLGFVCPPLQLPNYIVLNKLSNTVAYTLEFFKAPKYPRPEWFQIKNSKLCHGSGSDQVVTGLGRIRLSRVRVISTDFSRRTHTDQ